MGGGGVIGGNRVFGIVAVADGVWDMSTIYSIYSRYDDGILVLTPPPHATKLK